MEKQTGITTRQMQDAPKDAVFLWCNNRLYYPLSLARNIGREDLIIKSKKILRYGAIWFRGRWISGLVIDHATRLTESERRGLEIVYASGINVI